jgi:hypothetical protein
MFGKCPYCSTFQWTKRKNQIENGGVFRSAIFRCSHCSHAIGLPSWFVCVQLLLTLGYIASVLAGLKREFVPGDDRVG